MDRKPISEKLAIAFSVVATVAIVLAYVFAFGKWMTGDWCDNKEPQWRALGERYGPYFGECGGKNQPISTTARP